MANVKLRVTGLYFGAASGATGEITVNAVQNNASVKDILTLASTMATQKQIPGVASFSYGPNGNGDELDFFRVVYTTSPNGDTENFPPGLYILQESFTPGTNASSYTVWQYYIYDANLVQVNFQNQFVPFSTPNPFGVEWDTQEYTVVWRLVTITNGPILLTRKQSRLVSKQIEAAKK